MHTAKCFRDGRPGSDDERNLFVSPTPQQKRSLGLVMEIMIFMPPLTICLRKRLGAMLAISAARIRLTGKRTVFRLVVIFSLP